MSLATGGLISLAVAMGIGRFVYTPILPDMIEAIGLTPTEAGLIATANFLGYLVGALAASAAWLRGPHRSWFLAGLFASAITTAAMGLTEALGAQMLIRLLGGVASAFVLVFASALILDCLADLGPASIADGADAVATMELKAARVEFERLGSESHADR